MLSYLHFSLFKVMLINEKMQSNYRRLHFTFRIAMYFKMADMGRLHLKNKKESADKKDIYKLVMLEKIFFLHSITLLLSVELHFYY